MANRAAGAAGLEEYLLGVGYPADRREILHRSREQGAPEELLALLERLPERPYAGPAEVVEAVALME